MDHAGNTASFRPVVVLPTFNNCGTLLDVLNRILALDLPVIVVDDGSTDATAQALEHWLARVASRQVFRIRHQWNQGKAAALQTGFKAAMDAGYSHAVSIDSDGQLDPEQIPALLSLAARFPDSFVLGVRDATLPDYPAKSRLGRALSNQMIRLECGAHIADSQCGFRVYPLNMVKLVHCRGGRFGYESEIITRAVWAGFAIREISVNCRYFPENSRITHFKVWRDTLQGIAMHLRLLLNSLRLRSCEKPLQTTKRAAGSSPSQGH